MTEQQKIAVLIAEECRKAGMTLAGAAGVIANLEAESALRSNNLQDSYNSKLGVSDEEYTRQVDAGTRSFIDSAGYGLAQWTLGKRKEMLLKFCRMRSKSVGDLETQVDFLLGEMPAYSRAWSSWTTGSDPYQCGYDVCVDFERPANTEACGMQRGYAAMNWYNWLAANTAETGGSASGDGAGGGGGADAGSSETGQDGVAGEQYWPPRMLCKGMNGPDVLALRMILYAEGSYGDWISGYWEEAADDGFGDALDTAVRTYQEKKGLAADGIAGPLTWGSLGVKA